MNKFSYLKYAFKDKILSLITVMQLIVFAALIFMFIKFIPWLTSHEMSDLSMYETHTEQPPSWAKSFSVNHGTFYFYKESPADNRQKTIFLISSFFVGWLFLLASGFYAKKRIRLKYET